ncbi:MAG: amidase [Chloroflexota bacterium]
MEQKMDLTNLTLTELRAALRQGETNSVAATQAMLDRIVAQDNEIQSYLTITDELALEQAAAADQRLAAGDASPLLGVPIAVKDIISVQGVPNTAGSKILEGFIPPYDAFVVQKLKEAGAVILGKTNTDLGYTGGSTWTGWGNVKRKIIAKRGDTCPYCKGSGWSSVQNIGCNRCNGWNLSWLQRVWLDSSTYTI